MGKLGCSEKTAKDTCKKELPCVQLCRQELITAAVLQKGKGD